MLDVTEAAISAQKHLFSLIGVNRVSDVRLEEIEMTEPEGFVASGVSPEPSHWLITLSYLPANPNPLLPDERQRQYKIFKINADTGDFVAMKMRDVA
jgi:hypothetical protein